MVIEIPCKSYTKKFLESCYGNPVDLAGEPILHNSIKIIIQGKRKIMARPDMPGYKFTVCIQLNEHVRNQYGTFLDRSKIVLLNRLIEEYFKNMFRISITVFMRCGVRLHKAIVLTQEIFSQTEETFPFETAKKDFVRHKKSKKALNYADYSTTLSLS
jgi:hypothetical protein